MIVEDIDESRASLAAASIFPDRLCRREFGKITRCMESVGYELYGSFELSEDEVQHNDATNIYVR
jgi:hypothetical protein